MNAAKFKERFDRLGKITIRDDTLEFDYDSLPKIKSPRKKDEKPVFYQYKPIRVRPKDDDEVHLTTEQRLLIEATRPCSKCCHRNYSTGQNGDTTCVYCNEEHRCFSPAS